MESPRRRGPGRDPPEGRPGARGLSGACGWGCVSPSSGKTAAGGATGSEDTEPCEAVSSRVGSAWRAGTPRPREQPGGGRGWGRWSVGTRAEAPVGVTDEGGERRERPGHRLPTMPRVPPSAHREAGPSPGGPVLRAGVLPRRRMGRGWGPGKGQEGQRGLRERRLSRPRPRGFREGVPGAGGGQAAAGTGCVRGTWSDLRPRDAGEMRFSLRRVAGPVGSGRGLRGNPSVRVNRGDRGRGTPRMGSAPGGTPSSWPASLLALLALCSACP